jgi:hypothetical protein
MNSDDYIRKELIDVLFYISGIFAIFINFIVFFIYDFSCIYFTFYIAIIYIISHFVFFKLLISKLKK